MKSVFRQLLCLTLCAALACSAAAAAVAEEAPAAAASVPVYTAADYPTCEAVAVYQDGSTRLVSYDSRDALAAGLDALAADEDVAFVQPNFSYADTAVDDPLYEKQWALYNDGSFTMETNRNDFPVFDQPFTEPSAPNRWRGPEQQTAAAKTQSAAVTATAGVDVDAADAWAAFDGGERDVVIALIDTGVDASHEDLQGVLWTNTGEIAGNGLDDDGNGYVDDVNGWDFYDDAASASITEDDDHGTHCAGVMAATGDNATGVAGLINDTSRISIMSLKALGGSEGSGTTADIIEAIEYADANGANIVNLSLGGSRFDYALYTAMKNSGMLFVVAAGNDGADIDDTATYPACFPLDNLIAVASVGCDGTLSSFSNYGTDNVDLAAPGSYILSTTTDDSYSYMSGTSMAAPLVTAAAAMVYAADADATLLQVRQALLSSVTALDSLDGVSSGGMLNVAAALALDASALSVTETDASETGSAPTLSYETSTQNGQTLLTLTAADADGDLAGVYYQQGALTADDFDGGANGVQFTLTDGEAVFRVSGSGTVTFYAIDLAGNESVLTAEVTASGTSLQPQTGGQTPSVPAGGQAGLPPMAPGDFQPERMQRR
jgi:subtilisin family serine protease